MNSKSKVNNGYKMGPVRFIIFALTLVLTVFIALVIGAQILSSLSEASLKAMQSRTSFFSSVSLVFQALLVITAWCFWDNLVATFVKDESRRKAFIKEKHKLAGLSLFVIALLSI